MAPAMGMSETSTEEYTKKMRARYGRLTGRKARGSLLDKFIEITGWERKHANKVLLGMRRSNGRRGKRGAPRRYGTELTKVHQNLMAAGKDPRFFGNVIGMTRRYKAEIQSDGFLNVAISDSRSACSFSTLIGQYDMETWFPQL